MLVVYFIDLLVWTAALELLFVVGEIVVCYVLWLFVLMPAVGMHCLCVDFGFVYGFDF